MWLTQIGIAGASLGLRQLLQLECALNWILPSIGDRRSTSINNLVVKKPRGHDGCVRQMGPQAIRAYVMTVKMW